jgi:hypothetical protein
VFSIGIPTSAWFERVNETQENRDGTVIYSNGNAYSPVCLSTLLGIGGAVMLLLSRRAQPDKQAASRQAVNHIAPNADAATERY